MEKELEYKKEILNKYIEKKEIGGVIFGKAENLSWILSVFEVLDLNALNSATSLLAYNGNTFTLFTSVLDKKVLFRSVENSGLIEIKEWKWYEKEKKRELISEYFGEKEFHSDVANYGNSNPGREFEQLSMVLTDFEAEKYHELGRDLGQVMDIVASSIQPGISDTEFDLSVIASSFLVNKQIQPLEVLFAADERIQDFSYPASTDKSMERIVKIRLSGKRGGMHCSLTRYISFEDVSEKEERSFEASALIRASIQNNSIAGVRLNDIFEATKIVYEKLGFGSEFDNYMLGGISGYKSLYCIPWEKCNKKINPNMAIVWSPGIKGMVSEDSFIFTSKGLEQVTVTESWPNKALEIGGKVINVPGLLVKKG